MYFIIYLRCFKPIWYVDMPKWNYGTVLTVS